MLGIQCLRHLHWVQKCGNYWATTHLSFLLLDQPEMHWLNTVMSLQQVSKVMWQRPHCRLVTHQGCEWTHLIFIPSGTWFLGPTRVSLPNSISVGPTVLEWHSHVMNTERWGLTVRETDRQKMQRATSVAIGHIYALCAMHYVHVTWPKNTDDSCGPSLLHNYQTHWFQIQLFTKLTVLFLYFRANPRIHLITLLQF